jgi:RimJ/RimL family protein N-acetyltransferase
MSAGFPREICDGTVVLRQWKPDDFPFYAAYLADERTARFYGGKVDKQKAWRHLASLIGHWALRDFGVYAVASSATGELLGVVGLWEPYDWPCREFVYWFTADAYASGHALAAARLQFGLVRAARRPGEIITTYIHPENELGLSLAHQLGGISRGEEPLFDFGQHVRVEYAD